MSDQERSPEEIENAIGRRQAEFADDLEELEYRLSRRGVKDTARRRASEAGQAAAARAAELRHRAGERLRDAGETAGERLRDVRAQSARQLRKLSRRSSEGSGSRRTSSVLIGAGAALIATAVIGYRARRAERHGPPAGTRLGTVLAWLNDAYAAERGMVAVLRDHAADASSHPLMRQRFQQHVEETKRHGDLVRSCIERLGGRPSTAKATFAAMLGSAQGAATDAARDRTVKNALDGYAAEQFEVASYRALAEAAEAVGDGETARICRQILQDEEAMALWLQRQLPTLIRQHLAGLRESGVANAHGSESAV